MNTDRHEPGGRSDPSSDAKHPPTDPAEQGSRGTRDQPEDATSHQRQRGGDSGDEDDAALVGR
jgi:hypothetical protein